MLSKLILVKIEFISSSFIEHSWDKSLKIEFVPKGNVLKKTSDIFSYILMVLSSSSIFNKKKIF